MTSASPPLTTGSPPAAMAPTPVAPARNEAALTQEESSESSIGISLRHSAVFLLGVALLLGAFGLLAGSALIADVGPYRLVRLFDLNREEAIPTWYSSIVLLAGALGLLVCAARAFTRRDPLRWNWALLAVTFFALSLDEIVAFHESLGSGGTVGRQGVFYFAWIVPGVAFVLLFLLAELRLLARIPRATAKGFLLAGALYVGGAVGLEMIGGLWADGHGRKNELYVMLTTMEETLEMVGAVVFLLAVLHHLRTQLGAVTFRLEK